MRDSKILRAGLATGILLIGLHTTTAANADSAKDGYCSVINALDGKTAGGGKSVFGDELASISIALGAINGILHGYVAVDLYRYGMKGTADNASSLAKTLQPFGNVIAAIGTFTKSFIPFSTKLSQILGLPDGKVKDVWKVSEPKATWQTFLNRFVKGGATSVKYPGVYLKENPHIRFFDFYSKYVYRGIMGLEALIVALRSAAAGLCDQVTIFGTIKSSGLPAAEHPVQTNAANWWPRRLSRPAGVCALSEKEKGDALAKLYEGDKPALATMAAAAAKLKAFVSKWTAPMKTLAAALKPFESALSAVAKLFAPMYKAMKPIGDFAGAINSLLNKKLCFMAGKCFRITDIPNTIGKYAKKLTKPLMKKANKLFTKIIDKIIKALPTPPGMDTFDKIISQFKSIGDNITGFVGELPGSFDVPLVDWADDLTTMTANIAAIK